MAGGATAEGHTPLLLALLNQRYDTARRLIHAEGIDLNLHDRAGDFPLWRALVADQVQRCTCLWPYRMAGFC